MTETQEEYINFYQDLYDECNRKEFVFLVLNKRWQGQDSMSIIPGGQARGVPLKKMPNCKTLVQFASADLIKDIEPFIKRSVYE